MTDYPHSFDISNSAVLVIVDNAMRIETTHRIAATVRLLNTYTDDGIIEIIPSYATILVIYDDIVTNGGRVSQLVVTLWEQTADTTNSEDVEDISIDVVYGDSYGDDLANVSEYSGISVDEVITLHASKAYTVGAVGFSPGFTYLIGLPPALATPRRARPRLQVPVGSVGIGGNQTGIYALPSSGGWNLIGRTNATLFDPAADPPVRLKLGDTVRFRPIAAEAFAEPSTTERSPQGDGPIEAIAAGMQTTIQDLGRYGYARYGFATDGAADRASLIAANRLVGNPIQTAVMEMTQIGVSLRFHRRMAFALTGANLGARLNGRALPLARRFETMPGDELTFVPHANMRGARAYLAVRGGFDVPLVMGSASTNLTAGIGGWHGRMVIPGDRLEVGQRELPSSVFMPGLGDGLSLDLSARFRIVPGPQRDRFDDATWNRLLTELFTVSQDANRVAVRLNGPLLHPRDSADILSEGIVTGSIQVTGEGQAIVMLPGHATIGGYTKIATVIPEDWDRLGQLTPGDVIYFTES